MLLDSFRSLVAIWIAGGLALAAYVAARRLTGPGRPLLRWLATVVAAAWIPTVLFFALASVRWFAVGPAVVAASLLAAGAWIAGGGSEGLGRSLRADGAFVRRAGRLLRKSRYRWWVLAFALCAAPNLLRAIVLPPLGWDTLTYHGLKAGMWVQNGGVDSMVGPGPWAYYRNMLAGGEIFMAWAMLPFHADTLTGALEVGQWLALGFALVVLARGLGIREPFGSTAAGLVLTVPTVFVLPGSGYVEPVLLLTLAGGLALGLEARRGSAGLLFLAGAGLGVSAATKLPMVALCGVLLVASLASPLARGPSLRRGWALAGTAAFLAALVPWLLLAHHRTGAFLSPLPIRLGGWDLGLAPPEVEWLVSRPLPAIGWLAREWEVLVRVFHPPVIRSEALGLLAVVPLLGVPFGFRSLLRRDRSGALRIGAAVAIAGTLFLSPGLAPVRLYWPISSSRFLLPCWALATVVAIVGCRVASERARAFGTLLRVVALVQAASYVGYGFSRGSAVATAIVAVGLALSGTAAVAIGRIGIPAIRIGSWVVLAVLATTGLWALRDRNRDDLMRADFVIHAEAWEWTAAVPLVDRPGAPRTIAVTSGPKRSMDNWFAYPFLGRRLQNAVVYVPPSSDGGIRPFGDEAAAKEFLESADFEAWHRRLAERGVTEVISFEPASLELSWMEENPAAFERLAGAEGRWGLFRVLVF